MNAISRPFFPVENLKEMVSEEERKNFLEQIKEYTDRIKEVGYEFDEILLKLVELCEFGFWKEVQDSLDQIEHENLKKYLKICLERLLFIRQYPFIAQENKIFHKKLEKKQISTNNLPPQAEKKTYDHRSKLLRIYKENQTLKENTKNINQSNMNVNVIVNNNNTNNNNDTGSNLFKLDEKTEENLIYMLQRSEDYIDHPGLEDLCNPFSSKELIEEENLINFDEEICSFTYYEDVVNQNPREKSEPLMVVQDDDTNKQNEEGKVNEEINEACLEEIESVTSRHCEGEEEIKLMEIPEKEEFEEI